MSIHPSMIASQVALLPALIDDPDGDNIAAFLGCPTSHSQRTIGYIIYYSFFFILDGYFPDDYSEDDDQEGPKVLIAEIEKLKVGRKALLTIILFIIHNWAEVI